MAIFVHLLRGLACLAALALVHVPAQAAEPPPLSVYGNLPDIEDMALSIDGSRIAAVMSIKGERVVALMTEELEPLNMMRLEQAKVRSMDWVGNDVLLVLISRTETMGPEYIVDRNEFWHALLIPTDASKPQTMVFDKDPRMLNAIFGNHGVRQVGGRWLAYFTGIARKRGSMRSMRSSYIDGEPALYAVDPLTAKWTLVPGAAASQGERFSWLLGSDGTVAATLATDILRGSWQLKAPGGLVLAQGTSAKGEVGIVGLGKDGDTVLFSERDEQLSRTMWREVALDGRGGVKDFAPADEIYRIYRDPATGRLIGYTRYAEDYRPTFFTPERQEVVDKIYRAFPGFNVRMANWAPDFSRVLVRTDGNRDSGTWYIVDMAQMKATALGYEREAIGPEWVGPVSTVSYEAGDGLGIEGILTLPPGREPRNLPLVMMPHGGPHAHDSDGFDWWAQAFASRGYAVFQPNFRGSTNRDEAFVRAGYGQWGKAMQTDISDGIAALAGQGIVDPARACIVGASYGGYAALAGVTLQNGIYRCAVAVAPVADVGMLFNSERYDNGRSGFLRRSLEEELGPRSGFDAISPRKQADRADAPIMLIHGKDDTVVPFRQTEAMAAALRSANKPHEVVVLAGEDHWLSRAETRLQMLESAVAFVQRHNPAD